MQSRSSETATQASSQSTSETGAHHHRRASVIRCCARRVEVASPASARSIAREQSCGEFAPSDQATRAQTERLQEQVIRPEVSHHARRYSQQLLNRTSSQQPALHAPAARAICACLEDRRCVARWRSRSGLTSYRQLDSSCTPSRCINGPTRLK